MKTIEKTIIFLIGLMVFLPSCRDNEQENVFNETPDARQKAFFEQLQSTLTAAENGWIMQYFTSEESQAYNLYAAFDKSYVVELGAKHLYTSNVYQTFTSRYDMLVENGPSLKFVTYNPVLHAFSDPDIDREAESDFEFVVADISDKIIKMNGKRTNVEVWLNRLDGLTGEAYILRSEEMQKFLFTKGSPDMLLKTDDKTYFLSNGFSGIFNIRESDADTTTIMPFVVTPEGFRLYKPLNNGGNNIRTFKLNEDKTGLVCTDAGVNAQITGIAVNAGSFFLNSIELNNANSWKIAPDKLSGVFTDIYHSIVDGCKNQFKEDFESLFFTYKTGRKSITLSFKSGKYEGAFDIGVSLDETSGKVVFTDKGTFDTNGGVYLKSIEGFGRLLEELFRDSFTVTSESSLNPGILRFTSVSNPENRFVLQLN
jgi:hypothetical protein